MKANDLRIGNYVQAAWDGHVYGCEVKRIAEDYITLYSAAIMAKIKTNDGIFNCHITHIIPIPVNVDWCVQLGAKKGSHGGWDEMPLFPQKNGVTIGVCPLHDCIRIYINGTWFEVNDFYVHQLQNLYFAITNQELTIQ